MKLIKYEQEYDISCVIGNSTHDEENEYGTRFDYL